MVSGSLAAISECSACNKMTVSAVLSLQSWWVWNCGIAFTVTKVRCQDGCYFKSTFKGRFGKLLSVGGTGIEETRGLTEEATIWPLTGRGYRGLQLLLFRYFAKENNQTKEYSVICKLNEDTVQKGGWPQRRFSPTPNTSAATQKDLSSLTGGGEMGRRRERILLTPLWKKRKKI